MQPSLLPILMLALLLTSLSSNADEKEGLRFKNWTLNCAEVKGEVKRRCYISQNLVLKEGNKRLLNIAIGKLPKQDKRVIIITTPLGISLPPGLQLKVDKAEPIKFPIERCVQEGCQAYLEFTDVLINAFKRGNECKITFYDGARRGIQIPVSLAGFTKAFNTLKIKE